MNFHYRPGFAMGDHKLGPKLDIIHLWTRPYTNLHIDFHPKGTICGRPQHGPQDLDTRPWWKLSFLHCALPSVEKPSTGHHLWIYGRFGTILIGLFFDRRPRCYVCKQLGCPEMKRGVAAHLEWPTPPPPPPTEGVAA